MPIALVLSAPTTAIAAPARTSTLYARRVTSTVTSIAVAAPPE
jgi:hypothetical protein